MEFLEKVEQCGRWPQQACTTMFFIIPKNVTGERPIALMPTMIRWWEALRAPEVAKWQYTYRIEWDATDGRNGWSLVEMERFNYQAREKNQGAVAWQKPSSASVLQWCGLGQHFSIFLRRSCEFCGVFSLKDAWRNRSRPSRPFSLDPRGVACLYVLCCRTH